MAHSIPSLHHRLQQELLPLYQQKLGRPLKHHLHIAGVLTWLTRHCQDLLPKRILSVGRPKRSRVKIFFAFIAKHIMNFARTTDLHRHLQVDSQLAYICGWDWLEPIPSLATFSRAFEEFSKIHLPEPLQRRMFKLYYGEHGYTEFIARDASDIPAREKQRVKKKSKEGAKGGPRKRVGACQAQLDSGDGPDILLRELSKWCDSGSKVSPKGTRFYWMGYKLHIDVTKEGLIAVYSLTSASTSDVRVAIPHSMLASEVVACQYELMDKGYYAEAVMQYIDSQGRRAVIDKKACNTAAKKLQTLMGLVKRILGIRSETDRLLAKRTIVERVFGNLKDNYACRDFRVRGHEKVLMHIGIAILCQTIEQLIRLVS